MFSFKLDSDIELKLLEPHHAGAFYAWVEENRSGFENKLNFISKVKTEADIRGLIQVFLGKFAEGTSYLVGIWDGERFIGAVTAKDIDRELKCAELGYFIDSAYEGRGIVTRSVRVIIDFLFGELGLEKVWLRCEVGNEKSAAVAKRLGFEHEGTCKKGFIVNGVFQTVMLWGLLRENWIPS